MTETRPTYRLHGNAAPLLHPDAGPGTFGGELRRIRTRINVSQEALARWSGLDHSTISRLELGQRPPTRPVVEAILTALDVEPTDRRRLLHAAGYRDDDDPLLDDDVRAVALLLADPGVPDRDKVLIRGVLRMWMAMGREGR